MPELTPAQLLAALRALRDREDAHRALDNGEIDDADMHELLERTAPALAVLDEAEPKETNEPEGLRCSRCGRARGPVLTEGVLVSLRRDTIACLRDLGETQHEDANDLLQAWLDWAAAPTPIPDEAVEAGASRKEGRDERESHA